MIEIYSNAHILTITKEPAPWPGAATTIGHVVSITSEDGEEIARFNLNDTLAAAVAEQLAPTGDVDAAFADASRVVNS